MDLPAELVPVYLLALLVVVTFEFAELANQMLRELVVLDLGLGGLLWLDHARIQILFILLLVLDRDVHRLLLAGLLRLAALYAHFLVVDVWAFELVLLQLEVLELLHAPVRVYRIAAILFV